jgi:hypothetical protein
MSPTVEALSGAAAVIIASCADQRVPRGTRRIRYRTRWLRPAISVGCGHEHLQLLSHGSWGRRLLAIAPRVDAVHE